jgi:acyl-CoA hydrolase
MKKLSDAFFPGARVFLPGQSGESWLLLDELAAESERARDIHVIGVHYPGIGRADYLALHPGVRQTSFFMSPSVRVGMREGRAEVLPLDYAGIVRYLRGMPGVDVAVAQLSTPDARGYCSAGLCADFLPLVWARARRRVGHINPSLPRTEGSFRVHINELDDVVEQACPVVTYPDSRPSDIEQRIGAHVASLVHDGDTLQFGIGSVPMAIADSLANHRKLKLRTGMVSASARTLWQANALDADSRIVTGCALGSTDFYDFLARNEKFWFTDASNTHDVAALAQIPGFIAINSAVEVDLFGQVNSERADGVIQAGAGGLPVFAQAALQSQGGRILICLSASAKRGAISRIVPALTDKGLCTLPRHMADVVITEYGIAEIRNLAVEARAQALIRIAAPEHQAALTASWQTMRDRL